MSSPDGEVDIVGIGNAIVDVLSYKDDAFIQEYGLLKGGMTLIDADRVDVLYAAMAPSVEVCGGSCANTMVGAASFGAEVAYIGKVHDDLLGETFTRNIREFGVRFDTAPASDGPATARSMVVVSPDGQRTMNTYLGACTGLGHKDIDENLVARAAVTYLEGYLWDSPSAKEALGTAMSVARGAGRRVALTLSDPLCVERHRDEFRSLLGNGVDILFANEYEVCSLYEAEDLDDALAQVRTHCDVVAVTRSEKGSLVSSGGGEFQVVHAEPVEHVVDTTGAGDSYAAGFLYGLTHGMDMATCGRLGSIAAAEIISHLGSRPLVELAELARAMTL